MTGEDRETKGDDLERWKERLGVKKGGEESAPSGKYDWQRQRDERGRFRKVEREVGSKKGGGVSTLWEI